MDPRRTFLQRMLSSHRPKDATEAAHRQAMLQLVADHAHPFDRQLHRPGHFTASAFVLCPDRRSLLLILHGKLARWLQPGGHVDPSDKDVEQAARREVHEETGLDGLRCVGDRPLDLDVHPIPARPQEPAHAHFDIRYLFVATHLEVRAASDAKGVRWVPLNEVEAIETDASVMRAVHAIQRLLNERPQV